MILNVDRMVVRAERIVGCRLGRARKPGGPIFQGLVSVLRDCRELRLVGSGKQRMAYRMSQPTSQQRSEGSHDYLPEPETWRKAEARIFEEHSRHL
jgi:hypothetical protein